MRYLWCVLFPSLLQLAATAALIMLNSGGGSFVGLGVMLLAVVAVPTTLIANFLAVRVRREEPFAAVFKRCLFAAALFPLVIVLFYAGMLLLEFALR